MNKRKQQNQSETPEHSGPLKREKRRDRRTGGTGEGELKRSRAHTNGKRDEIHPNE